MSGQRNLFKIHIRGRVQGVGFRQSSIREARFRGLFGFVKNMSDGSVYIEVEGNIEPLNEFVGWCKRGSGYGYVEDVSVETGQLKNYNSFIIKY
jgi:acylphosphatase